VVFIGGVRQCFGRRLGAEGPLVRSAGYATWPGGQVSSLHRLWALDTLSTTSAGHINKIVFGNAPTHGRPAKVMWPASHLGSVEPVLCATSFPRVIFFVTMPHFGHNEDMHGFGPYDAFLSFDIPEMVDQQNSWNLLVISTYLLDLE
jgi:hypothetical protein